MLLTKRAHHCTISQTLNALMTVHSINYAILHHFIVIKDNSSVFFLLKLWIIWTKIVHRSEIFELLSGWMKIHQISHVILELRVSFSFNFASLLSARKHSSSVFFHINFICFEQKDLIKEQIFRLSTVCMKINQIPYVIFQATCQFFFKICINFQCHDT